MAGQAPALSPALHAHLGLVAQSGRALLRLDHPGTHPTRRLHLRSRARSCHPPIPRPSQCRSQALRLDQIGGRNPRKSHPCAKCTRTACFRESSVKSATLVSGFRRAAKPDNIDVVWEPNRYRAGLTKRGASWFGRSAEACDDDVPLCAARTADPFSKCPRKAWRPSGRAASRLRRRPPAKPIDGLRSAPSRLSLSDGVQAAASLFSSLNAASSPFAAGTGESPCENPPPDQRPRRCRRTFDAREDPLRNPMPRRLLSRQSA